MILETAIETEKKERKGGNCPISPGENREDLFSELHKLCWINYEMMTPRAKFRSSGIMPARMLSERRFSVGLRGGAVCIRLHISHVACLAIFASRPRNLVGIQPAARQTPPFVVSLASLPYRVAYCRLSSPWDTSNPGRGWGTSAIVEWRQ